MVQLSHMTYQQFNFTNTCMIQDTMYTVIMKEANTLSKQIMYEEEMAYQYKDQNGHFPVYLLSDNKPMVYPEDVVEYEIKQVGAMTFRVPKKKDITQHEFTNITGNPEYSR